MRMVPRKSMRRGFANNVTFFWYNLSKVAPLATEGKHRGGVQQDSEICVEVLECFRH